MRLRLSQHRGGALFQPLEFRFEILPALFEGGIVSVRGHEERRSDSHGDARERPGHQGAIPAPTCQADAASM